MHDGQTKKVRHALPTPALEGFLGKHRATIVTLAGTTAGNEYELTQARMSIGRGPGVALEFDDSTMSREHAAFEVVDEAVRLRDLGSTNGILVNGAPVLTAKLKHGDPGGNNVVLLAFERHQVSHFPLFANGHPVTGKINEDAVVLA